MRSSALNEKAGVAVRASSTVLIYGRSMSTMRLIRALTLLLLLMTTGTASATMPYHGWLHFDFPGYTSLHDCLQYEPNGDADRESCGETLRAMWEMSRDSSLDAALRKQIGHFGERPLFYIEVELQNCTADECRRMHDVRIGPPENYWGAPVVQNLGGHLLYHMLAGNQGREHRLLLRGLERDWQSDRFSSPFLRNFLIVQFDADQPGHLIIRHDWFRSLRNGDNYRAIWNSYFPFIMILLAMMLLALPGALLGGPSGQRLRTGGRLLAVHGLSMALALILFVNLVPPDTGDATVILLALCVLLLAALPEHILARRLGMPKTRRTRRAIWLMRLPFALILTGLLGFA